MKLVSDEDDVLLVSSAGIVIRMHAEDILTIGRNTRGVKLMTLKEGVVATVATTQRDEEEEVTAPEETTASDEALSEAGEEGENDEA